MLSRTNKYLSKITAPDGSAVTYGYSGGYLSSITYFNEYKIVFNFDSLTKKINDITCKLSNGKNLYRVKYTYSNGRVTSICEYGVNKSGNFVEGKKTEISYSASAGRTVVSAESPNSKNEKIKTVYTFDNDGNVASCYSYIEYLNIPGYKVVRSADNLLQNHCFETLDKWSVVRNSSYDLEVRKAYSDETYAAHGKNALYISSSDSSSVGNGVKQITPILPAGNYTFSAYVRSGVNADAGSDNANVYLRVTKTDGTIIAESEHVGNRRMEYVRLAESFKLEKDMSVAVYILADGCGRVFANAPQLESNETVSPYNMIENGSFEGSLSANRGWITYGLNLSPEDKFMLKKSLKGIGDLGKRRYAYQDIPVNDSRNVRETFTLSGWAKGHSIHCGDRIGAESAVFGLRATIIYTDNSRESYFADFSSRTNDWQYSSIRFAKKEYKKIESLRVYCEYDYNYGSVYFDDISLVRNNYESGLLQEDFEISENSSESEETTDESNKNFAALNYRMGNDNLKTLVDMNTGKIIYSASKYNGSRNDIVAQYDQRNNVTTYDIDPDTSLIRNIRGADNSITKYTYSFFGELESLIQGKTGNENISGADYLYDMNGNINYVFRDDKLKYEFESDYYNNLYKVKVGNEDLTEEKVAEKYTYMDKNGPLKSIEYANGDKVTLTYDKFGDVCDEIWTDSKNIKKSTL